MSGDHDQTPRSVWRWPPPLSLLWLLVPVVGIALRVGVAPVSPHDYWWHLAFGRLIDQTGAIPSSNLFLYTLSADAPFLDQPWLAQWLLYRLVDHFGHAGPYLLRAALTVGVWTGLVWAARRSCRDARAVGVVALVAVVASAGVFSVRSRMFALPLYAATVVILTGVADGRLDARSLAVLVPVVVLWANLHGSFVLAPALVAVTGVAIAVDLVVDRTSTPVEGWDEIFPWGVALLALLIVGSVTPHGPAIYGYVADITFSPRVTETVTEWQPLDVSEPFDGFVAAGIACGFLVLAFRAKRVALHEFALYVATAALAISSVRSVYWWAAVALMVVPRHLGALLPVGEESDREPSILEGTVHTAVAVVLIGATLAIQPGMPGFSARTRLIADQVRSSPPGAGLLSDRTPLGLVDRLTERDPGRIFHDQAIGGLLEYRLGTADPTAPRPVVFVDQRMGLIPKHVWDDYFRVAKATDGWRGVLEKWEVQTLLVHVEEQEPLVEAVETAEGWREVAREGKHVLFSRDSEAR